MKKIFWILILFFSIGSSQLLSAQENSENENNKADDSWEFTVTPYVWMSDIKGNLSVMNENLPVDLSFTNDLLKNLKMGAMVHAEAKKNRISFMIDIFYAKLGKNAKLNDDQNDTYNIKLTLKETILEGGLGYTFAKTEGFSMDALIGLRYFDSNTNVKINSDKVDTDINFFDPYVGVRFQNKWNKWAIGGRADIGGFDIGSDHSYKINGIISYNFSKSFATSIGYQLYKPDYEEDNFKYNLANEGFIIGFTFGL